MGGIGSGGFDGDTTSTAGQPKPNLLRRFVDEGDTLLGHTLETNKGREVYAEVREAVEQDDIFLVYDRAYNALLYTEKHALTPDDAKILTCAMIQKAVLECIQKELQK